MIGPLINWKIQSHTKNFVSVLMLELTAVIVSIKMITLINKELKLKHFGEIFWRNNEVFQNEFKRFKMFFYR